MPTFNPSLRLLADTAAAGLDGFAYALQGLEMLTSRDCDSGLVLPEMPSSQLVYFPALLSAARILLCFGACALFWILTAWPGGALMMTWATIFVLFPVLSGERAAADAKERLIGAICATIFAAFVKFALLPGTEGFAALAIAMGLILVPMAVLSQFAWRPTVFAATEIFFVPLVMPANQSAYDTQQFYNSALAIVSGAVAGAVAFALISPVSALSHSRRLLASSFRETCHLADGRMSLSAREWEGRIYHRIASLPQIGEIRFRQFVGALVIGKAIIQLRYLSDREGPDLGLGPALDELALGNHRVAIESLAQVDRQWSRSGSSGEIAEPAHTQMLSQIVALTCVLKRHGATFEGMVRP